MSVKKIKCLRFVPLALLVTLLACSFYHAERITPTEGRSTTTYFGLGEFLHSPQGLRVQDANSSFTLKDAEFVRANPLYGESEPTRNLYDIAASLFGAAVSIVTLFF